MKKGITIAIATLFAATLAIAEAKFGVTVYPGAKPDAEVASMLKKSMNLKAETYRTSDAPEKVIAFYRKQGGKEMPGATRESAMFTTKRADVTVQNPWMEMKTGKIMSDTLITIVGK